MAREAKITYITTGAERAADGVGLRFDQDAYDRETEAAARARQASADGLRDLAEKWAREDAAVPTRDTSGDRTYGPGQPDGMGPKRWWERG
ncbi:hypothetical protein [Streptomyces heilongjiangensis]|uniref:Uncharacterized protein n=1 Tax=Streptomyces heilongjiangensis TaxID=945052 RepID=A0ABW1BIC2_9ACTN|nr:hypothetical protein [Streptomyces heilongjiangensis]MDC2951090.1 hypothetical protein [Streptomyces heilongjiangensis]